MNSTDTREGQHVERWGHQTVPADFILMRRDKVKEGDEVISSHYGRTTVSGKAAQGTGPGTVTLHFTPLASGHEQNETYEADSLIPCLPHGTTDHTTRALVAVEALDRLAHKVAAALDPTHIDLTQARALLAEMTDLADTTTCSLVKDQGLSDRISRLAGRSVREATDRATEARLAAVTFEGRGVNVEQMSDEEVGALGRSLTSRFISHHGEPMGPTTYEPTGPKGECWTNAWNAAQSNPGLTYVEGMVDLNGYSHPHAWTVDGLGIVHEHTDGYEEAHSYRGLRIDTAPGSEAVRLAEDIFGEEWQTSLIAGALVVGASPQQVIANLGLRPHTTEPRKVTS